MVQLLLLTDFGVQGPYVGQMKSVLHALAPGLPVIDLMHDVPAFNAHAGAHMLSALVAHMPVGSVCVAVVDPGVGTPRDAVVLEADGRWFVGPDNGLLSVCAARAGQHRVWRIDWRPEQLSATFHGRDLFAPIAAQVARMLEEDLSNMHGLTPIPALGVEFDSTDLLRVIYLDAFGNAWTGLRGSLAHANTQIMVAGQTLNSAATFSEAKKGEPFWYVNSLGLVEIAANRASAAVLLGLKIGDPIRISESGAGHLH